MTQIQNTTMALSELPNATSLGWIITIVIFAAILLTLFLLSKNLRRFFYGAVVTVILFIVYKISRWIGVATAIENDYDPIRWFGYIVGFIIISIIIGWFLQKTKLIKKIEENFEENPNLEAGHL